MHWLYVMFVGGLAGYIVQVIERRRDEKRRYPYSWHCEEHNVTFSANRADVVEYAKQRHFAANHESSDA